MSTPVDVKTLEGIERILLLLQKSNVRAVRSITSSKCSCGAELPALHGVEFHFAPIAASWAPEKAEKALLEDGPARCPCGHAETEHGNHGLCLLGCDEDKCIPPRTDDYGKTPMTSAQ